MVFSIAIIGAIIAALTLAPMSITGQKTAQTFTTHSGAIITTTGQILDPLYTESTLEFDPMEFLRNFEYGKVTHLEDGTVLREFTIIADDSHIMEISPGVFYNVWAFIRRTDHVQYAPLMASHDSDTDARQQVLLSIHR